MIKNETENICPFRGGVHQLNLQLFADTTSTKVKVDNPYEFELLKSIIVSGEVEVYQKVYKSSDLSYYAQKNVANYKTVTTLPEANLTYLQSGLQPTSTYHAFANCAALTELPRLDLDTSKLTSFDQVFVNCSSLKEIDISNYDFSNVSNLYQCFYNCSSIEVINMEGVDTSKVSSFGAMFANCTNLTTIKGTLDMKSCSSYWNMFGGCTKLTGVKIKNPPSNLAGDGKLKSSQYEIVS